MSYKTWEEILLWEENYPNFGACHSEDDPTIFTEDYYEGDDCVQLQDRLMKNLKHNQKKQVLIKGNPGIGKTTFLYSLYNKVKANSGIVEDYFFYIFHANKAFTKEIEECESLVLEELITALEHYYKATNNKTVFDSIKSQEKSNKVLVNKLRDYNKFNKAEFDKTLILVVDDIDMLSNDLAFELVKSVKAHLENVSMLKWLVIRPTTFENYSQETQNFFDGFFPKQYHFYHESLFNIIKKRIIIATEGGKNPFSEDVCFLIQRAFDNNLRSSLPFLETLLETIPPKQIKEFVDESFIQNYISKNVPLALVTEKKLPNVHDRSYNIHSAYPLSYDLIHIINFTSIEKDIVFSVEQIARYFRGVHIGDKGDIFQLRPDQIKECMVMLEDHGLIFRKSGSWFLSNKAEIIVNEINHKTYNEACKSLLKKDHVKINPKYWKMIEKSIDYEKIVEGRNVWKYQK